MSMIVLFLWKIDFWIREITRFILNKLFMNHNIYSKHRYGYKINDDYEYQNSDDESQNNDYVSLSHDTNSWSTSSFDVVEDHIGMDMMYESLHDDTFYSPSCSFYDCNIFHDSHS